MSSDTPAPSLAVVEEAPHLRTAWHPVFIRLLEHLLPADVWRVVAEYMLTRAPRRIDAVIIRRVGTAPPGSPEYLRSVLDDLRDHNVVHFKGATDELEAADALQVLSYACQYMIHASLGDPAAVSLRVVAPTLTPRFRAQVQALGGSLVASAQEGVHTGVLGVFELRVVETAVVWPQAHEHLLYAVSPACLQTPRPRTDAFDDRERELFYHLAQLIAQLASDPKWKEIMKDATLVEASAEATIQDLIAKLPAAWRLAGMKPEERLVGLKPEERLVGLKPEERLVGLKPEERLADLDPAHAVLALPVEVLRALAPDYLATLPDDVQATVRARLAQR
jgi:hypothetical protein